MTLPRRIALVECSSGRGGSAKCVHQFAAALERDAFPVSVYCGSKVGWYRGLPEGEQLKVTATGFAPAGFQGGGMLLRYLLKGRHLAAALLRTRYFLARFRRDRVALVHTNNNVYQHIPAILAGKLLGLPVICHLHDQTPLTALERLFVPLVDSFFVLSTQARDVYRSQIPPERIRVVRNGLLVDDYLAVEGEARLRHPAVGVVGRLLEWKGQETLVRAAEFVLQKIPEATFYIVGEDPGGDASYAVRLRRLVRDLGLEKSVIFTGWIEDPRRVVKELDVAVCTSVEPEPFGLVLLEAMLLGTAVVATRHGGPLDFIEEGRDGLFYEPGDHLQLAELLTALLRQEELRLSLARRGRAKVLGRHDMRGIIAGIQAAYRELLEPGRPAALAKRGESLGID